MAATWKATTATNQLTTRVIAVFVRQSQIGIPISICQKGNSKRLPLLSATTYPQAVSESMFSTALIVIDAQKGFHHPFWGKRNNPNAEKNIQSLLQFFRQASAPIIHIQHLSTEPQSPLRPGQIGVEFIDELQPFGSETVFQKSVHSAFIGTGLEKYLRKQKIQSLIMVGFTSDHCVSTSSRMAANLGFQVTVISDATATFERTSMNGKVFPARVVHQVSLASLSREFALVCDKDYFIAHTDFTRGVDDNSRKLVF